MLKSLIFWAQADTSKSYWEHCSPVVEFDLTNCHLLG